MSNMHIGRKAMFQKSIGGLLIVAVTLLLNACAAAPPKPASLSLQISTTSDVNPDLQGRPSPVILYVLELASDAQFNRLDYRSLTQSSSASLGADLLGKNQMVLQPGESRVLPMELNAQTAFIGLLAGYRDNDNAIWRASVAVTQDVTKAVVVSLQQQQIVASSN